MIILLSAVFMGLILLSVTSADIILMLPCFLIYFIILRDELKFLKVLSGRIP